MSAKVPPAARPFRLPLTTTAVCGRFELRHAHAPPRGLVRGSALRRRLSDYQPAAALTKTCGAVIGLPQGPGWADSTRRGTFLPQHPAAHEFPPSAKRLPAFSMPAENPARNSASQILQVEGVRKVYGDLEVIRNVSLNVGVNEFVSILGPSGCGKSTLLMMIAGLVARNEGEILVNGEPVTGPRPDIGVVFQQPVLLPWRTVLGNVLLPIELMKLPRAKFRQRAMDLLAMTKIADFAHRLPRQLSGGMRQRASLCCALIHDPGILLMDEPFSALDAITRDEMGVELLRIWHDNRKTVVFVTHSIREAAFLSDRVLVMGRRPATIIDDIAVDLPRPRDISLMEEEPFNRLARRLRKSIEASHAQ
jgi:NitT/TauT family transport system ATP-binding protein